MTAPCPTDPTRWRVLILDDDPLYLEIARVALMRVGARVTTESRAQDGVDRAISGNYNILLLDLMMPGLSGEEVLSLLKPLALQLRVVVVTASGEVDAADRTHDLGAAGFIAKPIDSRGFPGQIAQVLGAAPDAVALVRPPAGLDMLPRLVFEEDTATGTRRVAAAAILLGLGAVLLALIVG